MIRLFATFLKEQPVMTEKTKAVKVRLAEYSYVEFVVQIEPALAKAQASAHAKKRTGKISPPGR
jgi:hypothetical protein